MKIKPIKYITQLLFPLRCPVCDRIVRPSGEKICTECMGKLKLLTPPWCMRCGKKLAEEGEFCMEIVRYLGDFIREIQPDALIPVPLHRKRLEKRGYNQAALLAQAVGRYSGVPVNEGLLVRVRNTAPLKLQNPSERQNNLKKAFNIGENDVKLNTTVIIDDIFTTGSTIDEAARVLKAAGIQKIYFITLACGAGL